MRLTGAGLLTLAGLLGGMSAAGRLRERARRLEALCRMLALLEYELERFQTPLPALFASLADRTEDPAAGLCRGLGRALGALDGRPFAALWAGALAELLPEERRLLGPLGAVLGRYGAGEQVRALSACRADAERTRDRAARDAREKGRMYTGLAAAGSAVLAVLLL